MIKLHDPKIYDDAKCLRVIKDKWGSDMSCGDRFGVTASYDSKTLVIEMECEEAYLYYSEVMDLQTDSMRIAIQTTDDGVFLAFSFGRDWYASGVTFTDCQDADDDAADSGLEALMFDQEQWVTRKRTDLPISVKMALNSGYSRWSSGKCGTDESWANADDVIADAELLCILSRPRLRRLSA